MGQKGHGDRGGKPKARWIDIGHGGEDDLHYRRRQRDAVKLTRPDEAARNTDEAMETADVTKVHQ